MAPPQPKSKSSAPKPNSVLLVLIATALAAAFPFVSLHLKYRAFDLNPRLARMETLWSLPCVVLLIIPITLLMLSIIRAKNLRPSLRALIVLSPVLVLGGPGLIEALFKPANPEAPFAERMGHPIPKDATETKAWFSHSPGESSYMFTFRCSSNSTDALLTAHSYKLIENSPMLDPEMSEYFQVPVGGIVLPKAWPEPKTWTGLKIYSSEIAGGYRYLMTDESRTLVFILVGDT